VLLVVLVAVAVTTMSLVQEQPTKVMQAVITIHLFIQLAVAVAVQAQLVKHHKAGH
jgi:hypothetical protein